MFLGVWYITPKLVWFKNPKMVLLSMPFLCIIKFNWKGYGDYYEYRK